MAHAPQRKGTCAQASGWDTFTDEAKDAAYEAGFAAGRASVVPEEPEVEREEQREMLTILNSPEVWDLGEEPAMFLPERAVAELRAAGFRRPRREPRGAGANDEQADTNHQ